MVNDFSQAIFQTKISKTGHIVPIVNDVHLHSVYNPIKEAETFVQKNISSIKEKNKILILGLGFAYHVNLVASLMDTIYKNDFEIAVIDPHLELAKDCLARNLINDARITIYSKRKAADLYKIEEFISFLMKGPNVLTHHASFNLHERFFKDLLSYRSPTDIGNIANRIQNSNLKNYFNNLNPQTDLHKYISEDIKNNNQINNAEDFLLLAFARMTIVKSQGELNT